MIKCFNLRIRSLKAKLIENKYIKREQFYIISKEDYDNKIEYLKSIINSKKDIDQQDKTIQLKQLDLQLEQEKTKQQQETTKQQQETTKKQQETTKQLQLQFEILKYKSITKRNIIVEKVNLSFNKLYIKIVIFFYNIL